MEPFRIKRKFLFRRQRRTFTLSKKLLVLDFYLQNGLETTLCRFPDVYKKLVENWSRSEAELRREGNKKNRRYLKPKRKPLKYDQYEAPLYQYIKDERANGNAITIFTTMLKLKELSSEAKDSTDQALRAWIYRFRKRHLIVYKTLSSSLDRLPNELKAELATFYRNVMALRNENNYSMFNIVNMDQTSVFFEKTHTKTLAAKGDRNNLGKKLKTDDKRVSIILSCNAQGVKAKPVLIFKGKKHGQIDKEVKKMNSDTLYCTCQENAWTDATILDQWVSNSFNQLVGEGSTNMLILDKFTLHKSERFLGMLNSCTNTRIAFIEAGMTYLLQPLDVGVNKPFKDRVRRYHQEWRYNHPSEKLLRKNIAEFVEKAWDELPTYVIEHAWSKIGVVSTMIPTEEEFIDLICSQYKERSKDQETPEAKKERKEREKMKDELKRLHREKQKIKEENLKIEKKPPPEELSIPLSMSLPDTMSLSEEMELKGESTQE